MVNYESLMAWHFFFSFHILFAWLAFLCGFFVRGYMVQCGVGSDPLFIIGEETWDT